MDKEYTTVPTTVTFTNYNHSHVHDVLVPWLSEYAGRVTKDWEWQWSNGQLVANIQDSKTALVFKLRFGEKNGN